MERNYSILYEFLPFIFGVVVFLSGYAVARYSPDISNLYDPLKTPWGVITAMLIYDGEANGESYAILAFLFILENAAYRRYLRVGRYIVSVWASLVAPLIANIVDLALYVAKEPSGYSFGQSGIVYGFWGSIGAVAYIDLYLYVTFFFRKVRKRDIGNETRNRSGGKWRKYTTYVFTVFLFLFTFVYPIVDFPAFFSVAPGVDSLVHLISFLAGLIITIFFLYKCRDQMLWVSIVSQKRKPS
jgi:hypothetical protein